MAKFIELYDVQNRKLLIATDKISVISADDKDDSILIYTENASFRVQGNLDSIVKMIKSDMLLVSAERKPAEEKKEEKPHKCEGNCKSKVIEAVVLGEQIATQLQEVFDSWIAGNKPTLDDLCKSKTIVEKLHRFMIDEAISSIEVSNKKPNVIKHNQKTKNEQERMPRFHVVKVTRLD